MKSRKIHVDGLTPAWRAMAAKIAATGRMLRARCTGGYLMNKTRLMWIISCLLDGELGLGARVRNAPARRRRPILIRVFAAGLDRLRSGWIGNWIGTGVGVG